MPLENPPMPPHPAVNLAQQTPFAKVAESYRHRFTKLSQEQKSKGFFATIRRIVSQFLSKVDTWSAMITAEHMSKGSLSGMSSSTAAAQTIELLKTINPSPELTKVQASLEYAHKILKLQEKLVPKDLTEVVKKDIRNLSVGESLAIPSDVFGHAMMMHITCIEESNGQKKFKVVQHNTGSGVGQYHYSKKEDTGKVRYQTALEIIDIPEENLCGQHSLFFKEVFSKKSVQNLYENALPLLGGRICEQSTDSRLWSHGQLGGSCTVSCELSLIRSQLPPATYKEFRLQTRAELILKSYRQILSGWGDTTMQKIVTLEMVEKLMYSYTKKQNPLPKGLEEIKTQLQQFLQKSNLPKQPLLAHTKNGSQPKAKMRTTLDLQPPSFRLHNIKIQPELDSQGRLKAKNLTSATALAFTCLQEGNINEAHEYIKQAFSTFAESANSQEKKDLQTMVRKICVYTTNTPLTEKQIYMFAGLYAALLSQTNFDAITSTMLQTSAAEIYNRFYALSLPTRFAQSGYNDPSLEKTITAMCQVQAPTPKGLEKIKTAMAAARNT